MNDKRVKIVKLRELKGRKKTKNKTYEYTFNVLSLTIYIPKHVVYRYGKDYIVIINKETGEIRAMPKKLYEKENEMKTSA